MKLKISIFLTSLILFTGCGDNEDSLSNNTGFFSNHSGSVWVTSSLWWLRINIDSSDEYYDGKCVNFPTADVVVTQLTGSGRRWTTARLSNGSVLIKVERQ